jgi:serine/threonine-protein kinase
MTDLRERLAEALKDRYTLQRELGRGGMATVYLAEDIRHERKVAVKVLHPELAAALGPDRFLSEIRTTASLQHPHILPLFDSGEADGFLFFVMPYVEGESLRSKLMREAELPIRETVRILRDVADALAYAHERGIVHRDIKPDNVMLSGRHALVADFGVAKAVIQATTQSHPTTAGVSMGTPAYMAPEQALADPHIDHRADVYAFGVLAYEMLSGQPPFIRETSQDVLSAHLTAAATPLADVRPSVSSQLSQLVMRCLEKRPADRWQRMEEVLGQLETLSTPSLGVTPAATIPAVTAPLRWPTWVWIAGAGTVVVLASAIGVMIYRNSGPRSLPEPERRQLTYDGNVQMTAVSPDGQYLAYVVRAGGGQKVMVQDLAGGNALVVVDSLEWVLGLRWSPDGTRLGVAAEIRQRGSGLYLFPRLGGVPQPAGLAVWFAWSPDGARMALSAIAAEMGIKVRNLTSAQTDSIATPGTDKFVISVDWSPRGKLLAVATNSGSGASNVWVVNLRDGTRVLALTDSSMMDSPRWAPGGDALYFAREGDLYRVAVDRANGRPLGAPHRLITMEGFRSELGSAFSLTANVRRLVYIKHTDNANFSVVRTSTTGAPIDSVTLTTGTAPKTCPTLSPDGASVAFLQKSGEGWDLYSVAARGGTPQRLTLGGAVAGGLCPAWGPSGGDLAFVTRVGTARNVAIIGANGGTPRIFAKTQVSEQIAWAPASRIVYQVLGNRNFRLLDPRTEEEHLLVQNDSVGWMFYPQFSPDRTKVAVFWNRPGKAIADSPGLWLISLVDSSQVRLVEGEWVPIGWARDGRSVYAVRDVSVNASSPVWGGIKRFPIAGGQGVVVPQPKLERNEHRFCAPYERPHGLVWVCTESESFSDVWMIENFDPEYAARIRR